MERNAGNGKAIFSPMVTINLVQRGDTFSGDYVGEKVNIGDSEIGQIVVPSTESERVQRTENDASADVEVPRSPRFKDSSVSKYSRSGEERKEKDAFFLQEKSLYLFRQRKFSEVKPILGELLKFQSIFWNKLKTQTMIAECALYMRTKFEAIREVDKVLDLVKQSLCRLQASDMMQLAEEYKNQNLLLRALIFYQCASIVQKSRSSPKDVMSGILASFEGICYIIEEFRKKADSTRNISSDLSVLFMQEQLTHLQSLKNVESSFKTLQEVDCMCSIGKTLLAAEEIEKSKVFFKQGIDKMLGEFGSSASKYRAYGSLLYNMAFACSRGADFETAESYYLQARESWEKAEDFESQEQKEHLMSSLERRLQAARKYK